jgi:hypothetical protein
LGMLVCMINILSSPVTTNSLSCSQTVGTNFHQNSAGTSDISRYFMLQPHDTSGSWHDVDSPAPDHPRTNAAALGSAADSPCPSPAWTTPPSGGGALIPASGWCRCATGRSRLDHGARRCQG